MANFYVMINKVIIGLGSNMGNRLLMLNNACCFIDEKIGAVIKRSGIYKTPPLGFISDTDFYNMVIIVETNKGSGFVIDTLLEIEKNMGRSRVVKGYSSRPIDLDILFFNQQIIKTKKLVVPHPMLHLRRFVLQPLCDIDSMFLHPELNKTAGQLLSNCSDNSDCILVQA